MKKIFGSLALALALTAFALPVFAADEKKATDAAIADETAQPADAQAPADQGAEATQDAAAPAAKDAAK